MPKLIFITKAHNRDRRLCVLLPKNNTSILANFTFCRIFTTEIINYQNHGNKKTKKESQEVEKIHS